MDCKIIENTKQAKDNFGHGYGSATIIMTTKMLEEIEAGNLLAFRINDEYTAFVGVQKPKTRLDVLKEQYPNAKMAQNGAPHACVRNLYGIECPYKGRNIDDEVCLKCWNTPI